MLNRPSILNREIFVIPALNGSEETSTTELSNGRLNGNEGHTNGDDSHTNGNESHTNETKVKASKIL